MARTLSKDELAPLASLTLLFVDDEEGIRAAMGRSLKRRFREYYEACDGREGLATFRQYRPDIVVTDVSMPVMDGLKMTRLIKEENEAVPVIVISAHNEIDFFAEAIEIGVDSYLLKPTDLNALLFLILRSAQPLLKQRALDTQNRLIQHLVELSASPTLITNGGKPECANKALLEFLGLQSEAELYAQLDNLATNAAFREAAQYDCLDQARQRLDVMSRVLQSGGQRGGSVEVSRFDVPELDRCVFSLKTSLN